MQALNVFSRKRTQQETFSEELSFVPQNYGKIVAKKHESPKYPIGWLLYVFIWIHGFCWFFNGFCMSMGFRKMPRTIGFMDRFMWESPENPWSPSSLMFLKQIGPRTGYYDLDGPSAFCTGGWGFIDGRGSPVQPPAHGRCKSNVTQPAVATWPKKTRRFSTHEMWVDSVWN